VDEQSIEALGDAAEGLTMAFDYSYSKDTPTNKKFVADFVAKTGHKPMEAGGAAYYGLMTFYEALELSGKTFPDDPLKPENLRQAILSLDLTTGPAAETYPSGHIKFNALGDNEYPGVAILQVQNGEPVTVWPPELAEKDVVFPNPHYKAP
jgi:branched-chain amino acid transport system substrate-binding protein